MKSILSIALCIQAKIRHIWMVTNKSYKFHPHSHRLFTQPVSFRCLFTCLQQQRKYWIKINKFNNKDMAHTHARSV